MGEQLPSAGLFVDANLQALFDSTIDQLLVDLGNPVKLFLPVTASGCPNCFAGPDGRSNGQFDVSNPFPLNTVVTIFGTTRVLHRPFPNGANCYICGGSHKIKLENSATYTATIQPKPSDINYDALGIDPASVYKIQTQKFALQDIRRSTKAQILGDMCTLLRDPVLTGLKNLRYAVSWWKKIE